MPAAQQAGDLMDIETKRALRDAFGNFATGVTVVTTRQPDGKPRGFTANSFSSVSLDPPLLLVCVGKAAHSCDTFAQADHFAVNILADDQKEISGLFASQSAEKFDVAPWHADAHDMPLITGAVASFSCSQYNLVDAGDHLVLIGRVLDFETSGGMPLGYFRGAYFDLGLDDVLADAAAATGGVLIGAVLENDGRILLRETSDGHVSVPAAPSDATSVEGLVGHLTGLGLEPQLDHLYAVYQGTRNAAHWIIYHGALRGEAPDGMRYFDLDNLPLERVRGDAERSMLRRYVQENRHGVFGIYHGTDEKGVVQAVAGPRKYHI